MPDWTEHVRARLASLRFHPSREADVVEELSQHLDERYDELKRGGAADADAHRIAIAELLEPDVLADRMRSLAQARTPRPLPAPSTKASLAATLWLDLRYAARALRKHPRFAAAVVLTLALGIGANTAIFSLVNATLLTPLPVPHRERLAYVALAGGSGTFSYPRYSALRDGSQTVESLAAWGGIAVSVSSGDTAELVEGYIVTGNFFDVMRIRAERGRLLSPVDDVTPGAHPVVVISHQFWQSRFGGADVVGTDIRLNGRPFTIVGVAPAGFPGPRVGIARNLYVPMMMQPVVRPPSAGYSGEQNPDLLNDPRSWLSAIGRLKDGIDTEQARAELAVLATNHARDANPGAPELGTTVTPVDADNPPQRRQMRSIAWLLGATVAAVLLIACANIANLLLTRAASRRLEFAVRLSLGASRGRLIRQLLAESVLMSLLGGAIGVGLALAVATVFRAAPPPPGALPVAIDFAIDRVVLFFTLALSILTGLVFGVAPAIRASRPSLVPALKNSSFGSDDRGRRIDVKKPLVVAQVALSLMLLIAAGLFVRGLSAAREIELGVDADKLVTATLSVNLLRYTTSQGREFYRQVVERAEGLPGVEAATLARVPVMAGSGRTVGFMVQGREAPGGGFVLREGALRAGMTPPDLMNANVVGSRFFETLGIGLVAGRDFGERDGDGTPPVVIINEAAAKRHFGDSDPLGERVSLTGPEGPWREIVGVVRNSKYSDLAENDLPVAYLPLAQNHETGMTLYVRGSVPPASLIAAIRREIRQLEPALPVLDIRPMTDTIGTALYFAKLGAWLLASFGALALLLAAVGIYGVLSFSIASRTREIGIRLALGAGARNVFKVVLRDGLVLVAIGMAIGVGGALAVGRMLASFLYGVSPADAVTFAVVAAILGAVALVACYIPARRAMRMDPIAALRYE